MRVASIVVREYTDPLLDELPAVAGMVARLAEATGPETVPQWLPRVQHVGGVGHFVHEEAPEAVLRAVLATRTP